ncbi:hypothetical protein WJX81_000346, partial [Elliptochloris bilobata]
LLEAFADMAFCAGFVHSDPHAGNVLVRPHPRPQRWWYSVLGGCGGWQEPQLVFLDHGRYIVLSEAMRQLYCQLWCSFIANDTHTAHKVAIGIAGERGGELLPLLLKPGTLTKMSKAERAALRQRSGLDSFADMGRLLEELPRELCEYLKVSAVVRSAAATLGGTIYDRLRINAVYALMGMEAQRCPGGHVTYEGRLRSRAARPLEDFDCDDMTLAWRSRYRYHRNGFGRVLLPQTAGVAVESTESSPATTAALMSQAAQLGVRPKIFTRPREPFEYADFDRHDLIVAVDDAVLEAIMCTGGNPAREQAWYAPRVTTLAAFLPYCGRAAMARTGGSAVLEPGLSRMVMPVLSRVLALRGITRPDLNKGAEEWNPMVQSIVVGCAGLVQYLADAYPPDLPDWDPL